MLEALKTAGLPRFAHQAIRRYSWSWLAILVAALAISLTGFAAHAADDDDDDSDARNYYVFQSVIMIGPGKWCIDIPASEYQPDKPLALSECTGKANQTFGFANGSNLTAGGLCLDGLSGPSGKSPTVGAPVVIAQCDGSDHQVWELQSFTDKEKVFAIANSDGLCVTADGEEIQRGTPLVLAQCAEQPNQGWLSGDVDPEAFASGGGGGGEVVLYGGGYTEPEYYWYSGQRYCWYDLGWHGPGWYWCGQNLVRGIGWGGPIGWHFWHHRGHRVLVHRVFFKDHPGHPGHAHAPFLRKAGGGGKATTRTGTTRTDTTRTGTMGGTTTRTVTKRTVTMGGSTKTRTVTMGGSSKTRTVTMGGGTKTRTVTMGGSTTRTGTTRTGPVRTGPVHTGPTGSTGGVGRGGSRPGGGRVIMSDIRAKHDIALLGRLENGLGFYRFRYNGSDQAYVGVMAQEVAAFLPEAVLRGRDGYLRVRYDMLGLRLQTWKDWVAGGAQVPH